MCPHPELNEGSSHALEKYKCDALPLCYAGVVRFLLGVVLFDDGTAGTIKIYIQFQQIAVSVVYVELGTLWGNALPLRV
jgi:hypothetical protein